LISTLQNDSDPYVRSLAAKSLGFIGDPRASDPLMNALVNDTIEVSAAASMAHGQVQAAAVTGRSVTGKKPPAAPKQSEATSSAPSQVEAAAVTGKAVTGEKPPAAPKESEAKGCAWKLWRTIYVIGIILVITGLLTVGLFLVSMLSGSAVGDWTAVIVCPAVEIGLGILLIFVANRRTKAMEGAPVSETSDAVQDVPAASEPPKGEIPAKAVEPGSAANAEPIIPEDKKPGDEEDPNKIGGVDIIWVANKEAVSKLMSTANASGLDLRGAVSITMGMGAPRDQLIESGNTISLSPARKVWCETTPIYRDNKGGGVYVMFEKLDDDICQERGLEFLGMIDAKNYAAALCMANDLDVKNLTV
jgi:hypothetical protein